MNTLKERGNDVVYYTKTPGNGSPSITGWDEWFEHAPDPGYSANYDTGTYLLAPVAKVVEVEIPGETKPVEPYVGLVYQNDTNRYVGEVKAILDHYGKTYVVIHSHSDGFEVVDRDDMVNFWHKWPTTTAPPRKEKRLVMLNGWSREGFASVSESGGTTDER